MRTNRLVARVLALLAGLMLFAAAHASDWKYYETKQYGFSMLVPTAAKLQTREWGGGWGGMLAVPPRWCARLDYPLHHGAGREILLVKVRAGAMSGRLAPCLEMVRREAPAVRSTWW